MKRVVLFLFLYSQFVVAEFTTHEEAVAKMNAEFTAFKKNEDKAFSDYKERLEREYTAYKNEIEVYWDEPRLSSKKEWVHYSDDKKSRSEVDFKNNEIVVEVIAEDVKSAQKQMLEQITYVAGKDTKEVIETDELQKRIAKLSDRDEKRSLHVDAKPILQTVLFSKSPTQKTLNDYAKKALKENRPTLSKSKLKDQIVYKVSIPLPSDTRLKRSRVYKNDIVKNAKRFDIPIPVVFAIMQTESDFNPFAKSHIPAFGLMQIVPHSAGRDTYRFLYKRDGMPTAAYLYNGKNNIEMGTSYLHILYYKYLKSIKNPQSRLYCTIAAYNTGAGNIAWAYTKTHNMKRAAPLINAMTPEEVYIHLRKNLRYDEPKHYLKNVRHRMGAYKRAYNL
jgi:peptidoglycan lytic transglycosylase C